MIICRTRPPSRLSDPILVLPSYPGLVIDKSPAGSCRSHLPSSYRAASKRAQRSTYVRCNLKQAKQSPQDHSSASRLLADDDDKPTTRPVLWSVSPVVLYSPLHRLMKTRLGSSSHRTSRKAAQAMRTRPRRKCESRRLRVLHRLDKRSHCTTCDFHAGATIRRRSTSPEHKE